MSEDRSSKASIISLRIDPNTIDRVDNLVPKLREKLDPRMSRSNVIRILISKGLEVMEAENA